MAYKAKFLHFKTKQSYNTERNKTSEGTDERKVFDAYISFIDEGPTICTWGKEYKCELSADFKNNVLNLVKDGETISLDFGSVNASKDEMPVFLELDDKINSTDNRLDWYNSDKEELPTEDTIPSESIDGTEVSLDIVGDKEYLCRELSSLTLNSIVNSNKLSIIRFTSGETPTQLSYPESTKVVGWSTPQANTTYNIFVWMGELTIVAYE